MQFNKKKAAAVVGATAVALAGAGVAFAYWTSTGNGSGNATTDTAGSWGVVVDPATGGPLAPGASATDQTVTVHVTNNGTGRQNINSVVISVANSDGTTWTSGTSAFPTESACSAADFTLGGQAAAGSFTDPFFANDDIAPGATVSDTISIHMLDTGVAQDNCQGLNPGVPLYVSVS